MAAENQEIILLLGAEFTQVWTQRRRGRIEPEEGAVLMETEAVKAA